MFDVEVVPDFFLPVGLFESADMPGRAVHAAVDMDVVWTVRVVVEGVGPDGRLVYVVVRFLGGAGVPLMCRFLVG